MPESVCERGRWGLLPKAASAGGNRAVPVEEPSGPARDFTNAVEVDDGDGAGEVERSGDSWGSPRRPGQGKAKESSPGYVPVRGSGRPGCVGRVVCHFLILITQVFRRSRGQSAESSRLNADRCRPVTKPPKRGKRFQSSVSSFPLRIMKPSWSAAAELPPWNKEKAAGSPAALQGCRLLRLRGDKKPF